MYLRNFECGLSSKEEPPAAAAAAAAAADDGGGWGLAADEDFDYFQNSQE